MYILKFVNESENKQYTDANAIPDLLNYVLSPAKTDEDSIRYNPAYQGPYTGYAPVMNQDCVDNSVAGAVYESMTEIREKYPRRCKTLLKHRIISFQSADLILPQDLDELGQRIISFYAQHGYFAVYGVHADKYNVHMHILVFTTNYEDGSGFHISYEWNNVNSIAWNWFCRHNQKLESSARFRQQREMALYGNPGYGELGLFCNDQIRVNRKKKNKKHRNRF